MVRIVRARVEGTSVPLLLLLLDANVLIRLSSGCLIRVASCASDSLADVHLVLGHPATWADSVNRLQVFVIGCLIYLLLLLLIRRRHAEASSSAPVALGVAVRVQLLLAAGAGKMLDGVVDDALHHHGVDDEAEVAVATRLPTHADLGCPVGSIIKTSCRCSVKLLCLTYNPIVIRLSRLMVHLADYRDSLPGVLHLAAFPELLRRLLLGACLILRRRIARDVRAAVPAPQDILQLRLLFLQLLQMLLHLLLILERLESSQLALVLELLVFGWFWSSVRGLHHRLALHLLHLLLSDHDSLVRADPRHVDYVGLELA